MRIVVYADGGCAPNPGPGGWGVVISTPEGPRDLCGGERASTNNRMELTAAIRALERFPEGTPIEMRCDRQPVRRRLHHQMDAQLEGQGLAVLQGTGAEPRFDAAPG